MCSFANYKLCCEVLWTFYERLWLCCSQHFIEFHMLTSVNFNKMWWILFFADCCPVSAWISLRQPLPAAGSLWDFAVKCLFKKWDFSQQCWSHFHWCTSLASFTKHWQPITTVLTSPPLCHHPSCTLSTIPLLLTTAFLPPWLMCTPAPCHQHQQHTIALERAAGCSTFNVLPATSKHAMDTTWIQWARWGGDRGLCCISKAQQGGLNKV